MSCSFREREFPSAIRRFSKWASSLVKATLLPGFSSAGSGADASLTSGSTTPSGMSTKKSRMTLSPGSTLTCWLHWSSSSQVQPYSLTKGAGG